jgi:hypothetical protein
MGRLTSFAMCVAFGLLIFSTATSPAAAPSRQALRTCIDRWNQGNMLSWGSMSVRISIRTLDARERSVLSVSNPLKRRCTLSLASRRGENSWICLINTAGAYDCPLVTSDGMPPLMTKNGTTDRRGALKVDLPLNATHATPPLAWQRRYPHIDGFILPWTDAGSLREGLSFFTAGGSRHYRGTCSRGSQQTVAKAALRCFSDVQFDPCFVAAANWNQPGTIAACAGAGSTRFSRFAISRRS